MERTQMIIDPLLTKVTYNQIMFVRKEGRLTKVKTEVPLMPQPKEMNTKPLFPVDKEFDND
jgi:hypothetical protein